MQDGVMQRPVLVVGHVNHDQIWQLSGPLVSGGRQRWRGRSIRVGGGGFFTGNRLLELGHRVELVSVLARDARGDETLADLQGRGIGTGHIARDPSRTVLTEILLAPDGERTILQAPGDPVVFELCGPPPEVGAAYLNVLRIGPRLAESLARIPLVLVQLPLIGDAVVPADYAVTSIADFPGWPLDRILSRARDCCGARLRALVLTDGPGPVRIIAAEGRVETIPLHQPLQLRNSIGAGDSYAGGLCHALLSGMPLREAVARAGMLARQWLLDNREDGA